jgi:hypothetical protein
VTAPQADAGHYYFVPFVQTQYRPGVMAWAPQTFGAGNFDSAYLDLRDPADPEAGYAFVRCPLDPATLAARIGMPLPASTYYVGQGLDAPLSDEARQGAKRLLGLRGNPSTPKEVLRTILLDEAGAKGKPGRLRGDRHGALLVYFGDLVIDLGA